MEWVCGAAARAEIKSQLLQDKKLKTDQAHYLIDLILNIEAGLDPVVCLEHTKLIKTPKGRGSISHQEALALRNIELKKAIDLLDGEHTTRCEKLDIIIEQVQLDFNLGNFKQTGKVEQIIMKLFLSGTRPPCTARRLFDVLF